MAAHAQRALAVKPWRRLNGYLRPERGEIWIILWFAVAVSVLSLATPVAVEALVSTVVFTNMVQPVLVLSLILFLCLAFVAVLRATETWIVEVIQQRLFVRLLSDLSRRLPQVRYDAFDHESRGDLANRFFDIVTMQKVVASLLVDAVDVFVTLTVSMVVLGLYHSWLLGFDIALSILLAVMIVVLGRGGIKTAVHESHVKYDAASWIDSILRRPVAFKRATATDWAQRRGDELSLEYVYARKEHFRILFRQISWSLGLQAVAATVLLGLGGWLVIDFQLSLGQLVAAELMVSVVVSSFTKLGKHIEAWYDLMASTEKVAVLLDLPLEHSPPGTHATGAGAVNVVGRNLGFGFPGRPLTFAGLNFSVPAGGSLAITGPVGSGKSSLAAILYSLRRPSAGTLEIDGLTVEQWPLADLRRQVALVSGVEVLNDTVSANIAMGQEEVTPAEIRGALDLAALTDELVEHADAWNLLLTEDGSPLSHSQALRLVIARAVAAHPRLLVLDGTLDALPAELAQRLLTNLTSNAPWTLVLVTQHHTLAQSCEQQLTLPGRATRAA